MEEQNKQREKKLQGGEIAMSKDRPRWLDKALKWLDNFWYHYKWPFLISLFFIITFAVCFVQCSTRTTSDAYIAFADGAELTSKERASVEQVLSLLVQSAFEEPFSVGFSSHSFFSEEELKSLYTYTDPQTGKEEFDNYGYQLAKNANQGRYNSFGDYVMTGDCVIWLVDSYVYEHKLKSTLAVPLKDTFGEDAIDGAYDASAIRLGDLEIYQHYKVLQVLPEDTLLVLSKHFIYGSAANEAFYQRMVRLYRAIVEFEAP